MVLVTPSLDQVAEHHHQIVVHISDSIEDNSCQHGARALYPNHQLGHDTWRQQYIYICYTSMGPCPKLQEPKAPKSTSVISSLITDLRKGNYQLSVSGLSNKTSLGAIMSSILSSSL